MDVELLARMVGELVPFHDRVGLPGLGTFVAEEVPASFSDRGYTINPPYRKLSFLSGCPSDDLLVRFYASRNSVDYDASKAILTQYLSEMKEVLKDRKVIVLPGLGRLRATRENNFFFVADPDLDIFPDGYGLAPVSLKSHTTSWDSVDIPFTPSAAVPASKTGPAPVVTPACPAADMVQTATAETPASEPATAVPAEEPAPAKTEDPASVPAAPAGEAEPSQETEPAPTAAKTAKRFRWWIPLVAIIALAAVALAVFMILAQVAPDFIDSILYTPEELRIINY